MDQLNAHHGSCGILKIPPELRVYIYEYLFHTEENTEMRIRKWPPTSTAGWQEPALLRTCHQVRIEATDIYYSSNNFLLQASTVDLPDACSWLETRIAAAQHKAQPFKSLRFYVPQPSWRELPYFIHLARLFWQTGLQCGESTRPLIQAESSDSDTIKDAMMDAVNIGRLARQQGR